MSYRKPFRATFRPSPRRSIVGPSDHGRIVGPSDHGRIVGPSDRPRAFLRGLGATTSTGTVGTASRLYDEGSAAYNAGNFALAEEKFREAHWIHANNVVLVSIARSIEQQGRTNEAHAIYKDYLRRDSGGPAATLAREGAARTRPVADTSVTKGGSPVIEGARAHVKPLLPPSQEPAPTSSAVYRDDRPATIAIWVASGVGILGLIGAGYFLTRPKKVAANRCRRRR